MYAFILYYHYCMPFFLDNTFVLEIKIDFNFTENLKPATCVAGAFSLTGPDPPFATLWGGSG